MKESYTIGKHKVATIFYLNECKLYCTFEREHTPNNDLVALMITYDDFAREDSDKWEINEHHYDLNGNFTYLKKEEYLTNEERNEIKDFIVDYFNSNYDLNKLLEK